MPSKKKQGRSKRTSLPRALDYTRTFIKDWERLGRSGRYDISRLKEAMMLLVANDGPLGPEWRSHPLKGDWDGYFECHIGGDFLLVYRLADTSTGGLVVFVRAGTHAELFE